MNKLRKGKSKRWGILLVAILLLISFTLIISSYGGKDYGHMTHEEAQRLIAADQNVIILDVRNPDEYEKKHIADAVLLPIEELRAGNFSALPDKEQTILIYCWTGRRAEDAAAILTEAGYTKVYEIGGIVDWKGSVVGTDIK